MSECKMQSLSGASLLSRGSDADALADFLSTPTSKVSAISRASALRAYECEFASTQWLAVGHGQYEGELALRRETTTDKLVIFLPRNGTSLIGFDRSGVISVPGRGIIADGALQTEFRSIGAREHFVLVVDTAELRRRLSLTLQVACSGSLDFPRDIDLKCGGGLVLDQMTNAVHTGLCRGQALKEAPLALAAMTECLAQILLNALPHRYSDMLARCVSMPVPRHVKRAIDYMYANIGSVITLDDLAKVSGVSSRTLQVGFREFKETSPMAFLQHIRLEKVRDELKTARTGQSVADIALKWGFSHLGRFASEYRARYGELPSGTLRTLAAGKNLDDNRYGAKGAQTRPSKALARDK